MHTEKCTNPKCAGSTNFPETDQLPDKETELYHHSRNLLCAPSSY